MSCGIFVQFLNVIIILMLDKCVSFISLSQLYIAYSRSRISRGRGVIRLTGGRPLGRNNWRLVKNNREDEDGFDYLRN
jgi:hypothetical protein